MSRTLTCPQVWDSLALDVLVECLRSRSRTVTRVGRVSRRDEVEAGVLADFWATRMFDGLMSRWTSPHS